MQHLGYILNFSTNYNASNFLCYFLPYISSGNILLFDQLTKTQIPDNEGYQEIKIIEKIKELKEHWDLFRLNPQNSFDKLKVNIILDYKPWKFTGFGSYAHLTFAKIFYLKNEFEKHFNNIDTGSVVFQFFVIKNKDEEIEELAHYLDLKNGCNDAKGQVLFGAVNRKLIQWPDWEKMESLADENINVSGLISTAKITIGEQKYIDGFASKVREEFFNHFESEYSDTLKSFLDNCFSDFEEELKRKLILIEDLNNSAKKKSILELLFKKLSSSEYLRPGKDMLFRFSIDTKSNASKIEDYEKLSAFLAESINFFEQNNAIQFLSCGSEQALFNVEDIVFNEDALQNLIGRYKSLAEDNISEKKKISEEKINVKQYDFNISINPQQFFNIDPAMQSKFVTVDNLRSRILPFFSTDKIEYFRKILDENSIQGLEDKIKANSNKITKNYDLQGDYGMSDKTLLMNIDEINIELNHLLKEESESQLSSRVNLSTYEKAKSNYLTKIEFLKKDFLESIRLFPESTETHFFYTASFALLLILGMPLYSFRDWVSSFIIALLFLGLLSLVGLVVWFLQRNTILSKFNEIYLSNVAFFTKFKEYTDSLGELAVNIRKSTLRRKNIKELEEARDSILQAERKLEIYQNYYNDLLKDSTANGRDYQKIIVQTHTNIDLPPQRDIRNQVIIQSNSLEIVSGNARNEYQNVKTRLGIIQSIKTS